MVTFEQCVIECAGNSEFVEQYDRLTKNNISKLGKLSPIENMIDESTGFKDKQIIDFINFVYKFVWLRLPSK